MSFLYSVVGFLIAIGVLVAVHEFGHFWVARKLGVKVLRFSVGFGKPIWTKVAGEDQIEYVLGAIPLGGYVKMLGEGDPGVEIKPEERHRAFDNQPIWKRALIVVAGPAINFLFAILLFFILGMMSNESLTPTLGDVPSESLMAKAGIQSGDQLLAIDGRSVDFFGQYDLYLFNQVLQGKEIELQTRSPLGALKKTLLPTSDIPIYNISPVSLSRTMGLMPKRPEVTRQIDRVLANSAAEQAGLLVGDTIIEINSKPIDSWQELVSIVSRSAEQPLLLTVQRGNVLKRLSATPELFDANGTSVDGEKVGRLGIAPTILPYAQSDIVGIDRSFRQAFQYGVEQTWLMSSVTLRMFGKMITGQVSHKNISGPITIAQITGRAIQIGLDYYLHILAVISISLGVMNLLPIPMLDGGHLMMYAVELIAGKNFSEKVYALGQRVGVLFLICLMSLAFYNDIFRLLN